MKQIVALRIKQLRALHVIHIDMKPENFLTKGKSVKLAHFGMAEIGNYGFDHTYGYVAPEKIESEE